MVPLFSLVCAAPKIQALAWADRLYQAAYPLPQEAPAFQVRDALEAYQQVEHRFGPSVRSANGIGNCLMLLGRYDLAAYTYPPGTKQDEARLRLWVAQKCQDQSSKRKVLQVERVPGTKLRWIVLQALPRAGSIDDWNPLHQVGIRQVQIDGDRVRFWGQEIRPPSFSNLGDCRDVSLYIWSLGPNRLIANIYQNYFAANCNPTTLCLVHILDGKLEPFQNFKSTSGIKFIPPQSEHGFRVVITPTYKVYWTDVYEWNGKEFCFANRQNPKLFPAEIFPKSKDGYEGWMWVGAEAGIHGRWVTALKAWRKAEVAIRSKARAFSRYDWDWNGHPVENLKEIRQRIRWITHRDYNHMLLYRPYDWDLQVPPYGLGKAWTRYDEEDKKVK